ncbi:MAG TPA: hypothetical protein PK095_13855 [Myxococcota bacterium]|nr:hypothetical protein [Myxococcota bacterium]
MLSSPNHNMPQPLGGVGPMGADDLVVAALDRAGIVGQRLRERLAKDLKAKVLFRRGGDAIEVIGLPGTGKHKVVSAAHEAANAAFGRSGGLSVFRCDELDRNERGERELPLEAAVHRAIDGARGGTLVFERFGELEASRRAQVTRAMRERGGEAVLIAVSDKELDGSALDSRPATSIRLKPLHERDEDIWELVDHFYGGLAEEHRLGECEGFSRQAKADMAEAVRETSLTSVRRLRDIVRDVVFEALAEGDLPLKLTSDHVRPYLERTFGQTEESRRRHDAALVMSQFDAPEVSDPQTASLIAQLAELHGVSADLLRREVEVLREVVDSVHGVPRSYRNIMTKAEDIQRAAMWLLTGASTQADFRRFFGEEGFMRPTKSVAWAFYNRVFQRET